MGKENSGEGVIHNGVPWRCGHRAPGWEGVVRAATGKEETKKKELFFLKDLWRGEGGSHWQNT